MPYRIPVNSVDGLAVLLAGTSFITRGTYASITETKRHDRDGGTIAVLHFIGTGANHGAKWVGTGCGGDNADS